MFKERPFRLALIISLVIHTAVLIPYSHLDIFTKKVSDIAPNPNNIEVNYQKIEAPLIANPIDTHTPLKDRTLMVKKSVLPNVALEDFFKKRQIDIKREPITIKDDSELSKKIDLHPKLLPRSKNPVYIDYYQQVREVIRQNAYLSYSHFEQGEVYASFTILSDGKLSGLKVNPDKSTSNTYLQSIAQQSIKNSSPFPPFPKELDYPELSFNVIISFELN